MQLFFFSIVYSIPNLGGVGNNSMWLDIQKVMVQ